MAPSVAGCLAIGELRDTSMIYRFDHYELDTQLFELRFVGTPLKLEPKVFDLLAHLIQHHDRVVTKQELFAHLWPEQFISEAVLNYCIMAARKAVGDSGRRQGVIKTVRGRGYRFVAAIEVHVADTAGGTGLVALEAPIQGKSQAQEPDDHVARVGGRAEGGSKRQDDRNAVFTRGDTWEAGSAWERKPVAMLAIDCAFSESMDLNVPCPDPWTVSTRWQQAIAETIHGFGGRVVRDSPSPLTAVFGLPHTLEQMPQRAVQAALAIRHLLEGGLPDGVKPSPVVRMAVHVGYVFADIQASDPSARLLALGETLSLPVRLLGWAAPGDILLSPEVGQMVEGWFELQRYGEPLGAEASDRIGAYKVLGLGPKRSPLEVHGKRPLSRFVGRDRNLTTLGDLLQQVEKGRGEVVSIIGEPGVGKSRVCYEFIQSHRTDGWLILESSPVAYGKGVPYLPIVDLLKIYFQIDPRDEVRTIGNKVIGKLRRLDIGLGPTLSALLALLDVPSEDPQWQALDPPQRRQRTLDAVRRLLLHESRVQSLLLVVENLHWIDSETQEFLDSLIESLPTTRMMLLVNYRPEYHHRWGNKTYYTQIRLDPLPPERAEEFLHHLLGEDAGLEPLKQQVIGKTEGNPFFLEESVCTLVETEVVVGKRGAYRLAKAPPTIQVPTTVQAILAARIDRLLPTEKHLLQCAAVIGREVSFTLLQAIAEMPAGELHRGLAHLQTAEFLYETSLFPEWAYTFKHALTQEVAYSSLPLERCRLLHARIVTVLEQRQADRLAEQVERLALHAYRGAVWDKAVLYNQQAGARAIDRAAFRQAAACYEEALAALRHLPDTPDNMGLAIDLRLALVEGALLHLGEYESMLALLRKAEGLARALDDQARLVQVLAQLAFVLRTRADHARAIEAGEQALALATACADLALQAKARFRLGQVYYAIGDYRRAAALFQRTVESLEVSIGRPAPLYRIESQGYLAVVLSALGQFAEGRHHGEEALRLAMVEGRGVEPMVAHWCLGRLFLVQGNLEAAISVLDRGLALCRAADNWDMGRATAAALGYVYALAGRVADGQVLLQEGLRAAIRIGALYAQSLYVGWHSVVCLLAGHIDEAFEHARYALTLAQQYGERGYEALALCQLGDVHARIDPPEVSQSEARYSEALALAEKLGMRPLQAHCHYGLGTLYAKTGRLEQVRAELSAAIALYRGMDMTFWLTRAEGELAKAHCQSSTISPYTSGRRS